MSPTAPEGLLFPGDPGISRGIVKTDTNNIAPRLGVAWDPRGDGRMSVRAGAGIFYGSITGNEWNTTADNQPFTVRQPFPTVFTLSDPYGNLPGGVGPFPFIYDPANPRFTLPAQVFGPSLDFVWPYTYQMNVTVEKELFRSFSMSASYVGALGTQAAGERRPQLSRVRPRRHHRQRQHAASLPAGRPSARRACSNRSSTATTTASSSAPSGAAAASRPRPTIRLERRSRTSTTRAAVFRRCRTRTGSSSSAPAHRPIARTASCSPASGGPTTSTSPNRVASALLNDWTISAIVTLQSGTPLTITSGQDRNFDGLTNDRADLIGDPKLDSGRPREELIENWFNAAAFALPAIGHDGSAPPQHRRRPGLSQRRPRCVPRHPAGRPHRCCSCAWRRRTCSTSSTSRTRARASTRRRRSARSAPRATCGGSSWALACRSRGVLAEGHGRTHRRRQEQAAETQRRNFWFSLRLCVSAACTWTGAAAWLARGWLTRFATPPSDRPSSRGAPACTTRTWRPGRRAATRPETSSRRAG